MPPCPLFARSQGQGAPVLLLHGLFGAGHHWQDIARRLAPRGEIVTVDLRNHGRSPHTPRMDYAAMADDVLALLDARRIERASIVGHSMGGKVAMTLALRAPHRVGRLAVIDIAPVAYPDRYGVLARAAESLDLCALRSREQADTELAARIPQPALRAMLLQNLTLGAEGWRWRIGWAGILASLEALCGFPADLAGLHGSVPSLFVKGGASDHVDDAGELAIMARFPRAQILSLAGAGHWVQADQPAALAKLLADFLFEPADPA
jgi:pimeloyl-ACP methyl ester carboxylesterase